MKPPRYPVPNIKLEPEDFDTKQLRISYKVEDLLIFHWSFDTYNNFSTSCHSNKGHHQKNVCNSRDFTSGTKRRREIDDNIKSSPYLKATE